MNLFYLFILKYENVLLIKTGLLHIILILFLLKESLGKNAFRKVCVHV